VWVKRRPLRWSSRAEPPFGAAVARSSFSFQNVILPKSNGVRSLLAAVLVLAVAAVGYFWWHGAQVRSLALAAVPARPEMDSAPPELVARVAQAEDDVSHGAHPLEGLKDLSRLYQANGYLSAAIQVYDGLRRAEPKNPHWPHLEAGLLAGFGRLEEAIPLLRRTLELSPDYVPARIRLADALLKTNQTDAAANEYRNVLSADPNNVYALLGTARCKMEAKHWSLAEENLRRAVQAKPTFSAAWQLLSTLAEQRGDADAAVRAEREAAKGTRFQDIPDAWADELLDDCYDPYKLRVAAAVMEEARNPGAGIHLLERAVRLSPDNAPAHRELGRLYMQQNQLAEARPHLEKAVSLAPDDAENWIGLVKVTTAMQDSAGLNRALLAGLSHCPASPSLHLERGRQLLAARQIPEALVEFEESKRLRPNEPDALLQIGIAYLYLGDTVRGLAAMQEVLRVQPDHPTALLALCRGAVDNGNEEVALRWLSRLRQQVRLRPEDWTEISDYFQQRFGHAPTT